jgi:hypothetical protein
MFEDDLGSTVMERRAVPDPGDPHHRSLWSEDTFVAELSRDGPTSGWTAQSIDEEQSHWLVLLASKPG